MDWFNLPKGYFYYSAEFGIGTLYRDHASLGSRIVFVDTFRCYNEPTAAHYQFFSGRDQLNVILLQYLKNKKDLSKLELFLIFGEEGT